MIAKQTIGLAKMVKKLPQSQVRALVGSAVKLPPFGQVEAHFCEVVQNGKLRLEVRSLYFLRKKEVLTVSSEVSAVVVAALPAYILDLGEDLILCDISGLTQGEKQGVFVCFKSQDIGEAWLQAEEFSRYAADYLRDLEQTI